ncbi:chitotriosidase-1 [Biomphalaria glabrata]|nr:chitotriosidase-1 [Biomphalaria glabrata]
MMKNAIVSLFFSALIYLSSEKCDVIMCTLLPRTMSQTGITREDIDPTVCPYLRIKFAEYYNGALAVDKRVSDTYPWLWDAKVKNPSMKIVLTFLNPVGDDKFYEMYRTPYQRLKFIPLLVTHLRNNKFDGVELDLDMGVGLRSPERYHIDRWADFVQVVQSALVDEATRSGKPKIVLFGRIDERIMHSYEFYNVPRMYRHSDLVILEAWAFYSQKLGPRFNISLTGTHHCKIYKTNENDKNCVLLTSRTMATSSDDVPEWLKDHTYTISTLWASIQYLIYVWKCKKKACIPEKSMIGCTS